VIRNCLRRGEEFKLAPLKQLKRLCIREILYTRLNDQRVYLEMYYTRLTDSFIPIQVIRNCLRRGEKFKLAPLKQLKHFAIGEIL